MRRRSLVIGAATLLAGAAGWHYQSEILGSGARWYLERVAARERDAGEIKRRRDVVTGFHRLLLMSPPTDVMVPELFEFVTLLSSRVATGEVTLAWGAYLYTSYVRDMVRDRPQGTPVRSREQVQAELDRQLDFFRIVKRPDVAGFRLSDLIGGVGDSYSLEDIQQAEREGRDLPLK